MIDAGETLLLENFQHYTLRDVTTVTVVFFSLRSKRFGKAFRTFDALFAFLAAGKLGRAQKSAWRGRGKERRNFSFVGILVL